MFVFSLLKVHYFCVHLFTKNTFMVFNDFRLLQACDVICKKKNLYFIKIYLYDSCVEKLIRIKTIFRIMFFFFFMFRFDVKLTCDYIHLWQLTFSFILSLLRRSIYLSIVLLLWLILVVTVLFLWRNQCMRKVYLKRKNSLTFTCKFVVFDF